MFVFLLIILPLFNLYSYEPVQSQVFLQVTRPSFIEFILDSSYPPMANTDEIMVDERNCIVSNIGVIELKNIFSASWTLTIDGQDSGKLTLVSDEYNIEYQLFTNISQDGLSYVGNLSTQSGCISSEVVVTNGPRQIQNPGKTGNFINSTTSGDFLLEFQTLIPINNFKKPYIEGAFNEDRVFEGLLIWTYIEE